jgi:acyl-CoA thioester hydrolase
MRWADMDLLGHVNNVTYLDYVAEAREHLFPGSPTGRALVTRHRVEFASPLVFRRRPVLVDSWVTELGEDNLALAHEVYDAPESPDGERTVHARISSELAVRVPASERTMLEELRAPDHTWRPLADESRPGGDLYTLTVRRGDIDEQGLARDVAFFEFLQEARIKFLMGLHTRGQRWEHHVVARTDVTYLEPLRRRPEPYAIRSWIGHVGTRSFTVRAEVLDGERVLARAAVVMVIFDMETQRPTDMADTQRDRLLQELGES